MAKHSMKGSGSGSGGSINSRAVSSRPSNASSGVVGSPSLRNVGSGIGKGNINTRYQSTQPSGDSGVKGSAQPLKNVGTKSNKANTSALGSNVYRSAKPNK
jgi:hypothetical protein